MNFISLLGFLLLTSTYRFLLPYSSSFFSVEFSEPSTEEAKNLQNIEIPFTHAYMNTVN